MNFLKPVLDFVKAKYSNWHAKKVKQFRTEEIAKTLSIAHAVELSNTPGEMWPVTKERQSREIAAVRDGNITIVDRRSWQFPYLPSSISRIRQPILKMTPFNIRRFAKSPIPRRALNLIKNAVLSLEWDILPIKGTFSNSDPDTKSRIEAAKKSFNTPNGTDSFQSFMEQNLEDFILLGASSIEPQLTPDPARPFKAWSVDTSTIRIFPTWSESNSKDEPRYAQMTGLLGERGIVPFMDDELLYIRDNPTNETPFGLGKMEVAFQSVTAFLGVQEMSGRAGSDQIHKTWLWWQGAVAPAHTDQVRRHITNDLEGQAKVSIVAGMPKPDVIEITPVQEADLLLNWQELLIRIIAAAFDLSAASFLERDVNRSTGEVLQDSDFRSAVVPVAMKLAEAFTRFFLHRLLGWKDLEFKFLNLDDPDPATKMVLQQQLYAMNGTYANEIRAKLGMPPLTTPLAELTQIELILLNTEAAANIQNQNADKAASRQLGVQQQQMSMQQQYEQAQGGQSSEQQAAASKGALPPPKLPGLKAPKAPTLKPPKALSLPKMPMAGCMLNAQQVAAMSPNSLNVAISSGLVTPNISLLCDQMETQEPGILEQVSDELAEYLEMLKEKQLDLEKQSKVKITPKMKKNQEDKYNKFQHKQTIVEKNYNTTRQGTPKSRATTQKEGERLGTRIDKIRKPNKIKTARNTPVTGQ